MITRAILGAVALCLAGLAQSAWADDAPPEAPPTVLDITPASIQGWAHGLNRGEQSWNNCLSLLNATLVQPQGGPRNWEYKEIVDPEAVKELIDPHAPIAFYDYVTALFVADRELAAQALNAPADVHDGETWVSVKRRPEVVDDWSMFQGNRLITGNETTMQRMEERLSAESQMLAEVLPESELQILNAADAVGVMPRAFWVTYYWNIIFRPTQAEAEPSAEEVQVQGEIRRLAGGIEWLTGSMRVEFADGDAERDTPLAVSLHTGIVFDHHPVSEGAKLLAAHATPDRSSTLAGLPQGDPLYVFAGSFADGDKLTYYRQLAEICQRHWNRFHQRSVPLPARQFYRIAEEVGDHMQGLRMAAYRNPEPASDGVYSLVIIADADEPGPFIAELQQMMRLAGADEADLTNPNDAATDAVTDEEIEALVADLGDRVYRVRRDATNRLLVIGTRATPFLEARLDDESLELRTRAKVILDHFATLQSDDATTFFGSDLLWRLDPDFSYVIAGETLADGTPIDWITVTVPEESQPYMQQFEAWLGPDWNRWRVVQTDNEIVICVGSRPELLTETLSNLSDPSAPSLEIDNWNPEGIAYQFQLHFDAYAFVPERMSYINSQLEPGEEPGLTSFGLTLAADALTCDIHLPVTQLRRLAAWLSPRV